MVRIENKLSSRHKSSNFRIENYIANSQSHTPTIMATPLVETSSFTAIQFPSVEDQITLSFRVVLKMIIIIH